MNQDITDKPIVLSLNRVWQPIGHRTVRQALVALMGGSSGNPPALGLDIDYELQVDGTPNFDTPSLLRPVSWAEWLELPIRSFDLVVRSPGRTVRVPTVMVSTQYSRMPMHHPKPSRNAIFSRDGGVCQYTGERVGKRGGNLDHVVPKHRGGRDSFENLVWSKREINSFKANRLPHEAGLQLMRRPREPAPIPIAATIREPKHRDWRHFLTQ